MWLRESLRVLAGEFRRARVNPGVALAPRMLSVEPESAGTDSGIAKALGKRPEMRNAETIGSRRFSVTGVSGPLVEGPVSSADGMVFGRTLGCRATDVNSTVVLTITSGEHLLVDTVPVVRGDGSLSSSERLRASVPGVNPFFRADGPQASYYCNGEQKQ